MNALPLGYVRDHVLGRRVTGKCSDGVMRTIRPDSIDALNDGHSGWYLSGLDSEGFRHGMSVINDFGNVSLEGVSTLRERANPSAPSKPTETRSTAFICYAGLLGPHGWEVDPRVERERLYVPGLGMMLSFDWGAPLTLTFPDFITARPAHVKFAGPSYGTVVAIIVHIQLTCQVLASRIASIKEGTQGDGID